MDKLNPELNLLFKYGIDLENRRLYMVGEIDDDNFETYLKAIHYFNDQENKEPIELYLDSNGGSVSTMCAFYDAIRSSDMPIYTIATGEVCSAAVLILLAGHLRFATENAYLMHHLASNYGGGGEDEREIQARAKQFKAWSKRTYKLLAYHSLKTAKWWEDQATTEGEVWLDANTMHEFGVVDEVIKNPKRVTRKASKPKRQVTRKNK
jgi:ATP-dependent Clp protease protease subunit